MIAIAQKLDEKMRQWNTEKATSVEKIINEVIELADENCLDILRSRVVEQEVLDIIDET